MIRGDWLECPGHKLQGRGPGAVDHELLNQISGRCTRGAPEATAGVVIGIDRSVFISSLPTCFLALLLTSFPSTPAEPVPPRRSPHGGSGAPGACKAALPRGACKAALPRLGSRGPDRWPAGACVTGRRSPTNRPHGRAGKAESTPGQRRPPRAAAGRRAAAAKRTPHAAAHSFQLFAGPPSSPTAPASSGPARPRGGAAQTERPQQPP